MSTVVFPAMTSVQLNELTSLRSGNQRLVANAAAKNETTSRLRAELKLAAQKLRALEAEFKALSFGAVFEGKNPLPFGYRSVRFGDPLSRVVEEFGKERYELRDGYATVSGNISPFGAAVYFFDKDSAVKFIGFRNTGFVEKDFGANIKAPVLVDNSQHIYRKLQDAFGQPNIERRAEGLLLGACWFNRDGIDIEYSSHMTVLFPAFEYKLGECGSEEEVDIKRAELLTCPAPPAFKKAL